MSEGNGLYKPQRWPYHRRYPKKTRVFAIASHIGFFASFMVDIYWIIRSLSENTNVMSGKYYGTAINWLIVVLFFYVCCLISLKLYDKITKKIKKEDES
jgi:hypothetical protein